jgi:hypothetical protein
MLTCMETTANHIRQEQCVTINGRDYTVYFRDDGTPCTVCVHVQQHGYTTAMRRLPLSAKVARLAIQKVEQA